MTQEITRKQVWIRLPVEVDEGEKPPVLFDGDSYLVRLADGRVEWAMFVIHHGTHWERIEEEGDESTGEIVGDVVAVLISGGAGPGVADRIIAAAEAARVALGPRYHAESLIDDTEPLLSSERDMREWDRFEAVNRALAADQQVD